MPVTPHANWPNLLGQSEIASFHRMRRATAHEVRDNLADLPSYSAVRALLRLLEERGHVKHAEEGQRYVYSPSAAPSEARRSALSQVVRTFFGGSVEQAVAALVDTSKPRLSQEEQPGR